MLGSFAYGVHFQVLAAALAKLSGHQKGHELALILFIKVGLLQSVHDLTLVGTDP